MAALGNLFHIRFPLPRLRAVAPTLIARDQGGARVSRSPHTAMGDGAASSFPLQSDTEFGHDRSQQLVLIRRTPAAAAVTGAILALVIVAGFLALDHTTLHWYAESGNATSGPAYSGRDVASLTLTQISATPFPSGMTSLHCYEANYVTQDRLWVVRCGYWVTRPSFATPGVPDHPPDYPETLSFDDRTGRVVK